MNQSTTETPRIDGHIIDVIRRTITEITVIRFHCPASLLASRLIGTYPRMFGPDNWAGYPSLKQLLTAYGKFFETYYPENSQTDLMVRIRSEVKAAQSKNSMTSLTLPNIVNSFFTDDKCRQLHKSCNLSDDLSNPSRLRQIILYRMYRLDREGKIFRARNYLACNPGLLTNEGIDPLYLQAVESPQGLVVKLIDRGSEEGRKMVRRLGNIELKSVWFPPAFYDKSLDINPEYSHILDDHPERLPGCLLEMVTRHPDYPPAMPSIGAEDEVLRRYRSYLIRQLMGAVELAKTKLRNGVVEPAPFWFKTSDKMCWLVPLELGIGNNPSVALVLDMSECNGEPIYRAHTVLTIEDAYRSARLVGEVRAQWLADYQKGLY